MTKNDIAVELCKRIPDLPKSTALHVVDGVTDILADAFDRGENVYLRGFGTMEVKTTKKRRVTSTLVLRCSSGTAHCEIQTQ